MKDALEKPALREASSWGVASTDLLPWLLLVATLMLAAGPRVSAVFRTQARPSVLTFATVQFFLGLYGGYFGGAVGLMMLAAWSALGGGAIKSLNPTRMVMVTAANAVAVIVFVLAGAIVWQACIAMTIGAVIGGWIGAHIGRRLPSSVVRVLTLTVALLTTAVFFSRTYLCAEVPYPLWRSVNNLQLMEPNSSKLLKGLDELDRGKVSINRM
nr:sulfite exporter TauE/SafE family protein [Rhizobium laguerreae]